MAWTSNIGNGKWQVMDDAGLPIGGPLASKEAAMTAADRINNPPQEEKQVPKKKTPAKRRAKKK